MNEKGNDGRVPSLPRKRFSAAPPMGNVTQLLEHGKHLMIENRPDAAMQSFHTVLSREPENPAAHYYISRLYLSSNDMTRGLHHLTTAYKLQPFNREIVMDCAMTMWQVEETATAAQICELYLNRYPDDGVIRELSDQLRKRLSRKTTSNLIVSENFHFIWVSIPKAASSLLTDLFYRKPAMEYRSRLLKKRLDELKQFSPQYQDYYTFAFVRNPWSRVVSIYNSLFCSPLPQMEENFLDGFPGLKREMSFPEFVTWLCENWNGIDEGAHSLWISQHKLITDINGKLIVDFVGKTDSLQRDLRKVCNTLGLPDEVYQSQRLNPGKDKMISYRSFYSHKTERMIAERYETDIEMFGFTF